MDIKPWTSGPKELLSHAVLHMKNGQAFDYRIAMISIDNAVELSIKTYLQLPKRIRGTEGPSRKEIQDKGSSFPDLLDLLEHYGEDKLDGISLGDIEVYHRLRNTLYHDGNGVTVDPVHVDGYLQVAQILVKGLLGIKASEVAEASPTTLLGELVLKWGELEVLLRALAKSHLPKSKHESGPALSIVDGLVAKGVLTGAYRSRLEIVSRVRNEYVHGTSAPEESRLKPVLVELNELVDILKKI